MPYLKAKPRIIVAQGVSGHRYEFELYVWETKFDAVGAVYMVLKESFGRYDILYVGQTEDLELCFEGHHKQPCFDRSDKSHIAVHSDERELSRLRKEADLVAKYAPLCNE